MRRAILKYKPLLCNRRYHSSFLNSKPPTTSLPPTSFRFFSSSNTQTPNLPNPTSPSSTQPSKTQDVAVEDVSNKEFETQVNKYLQEDDENALPLIFESILKRQLQSVEKEAEADKKLMNGLENSDLEDVVDAESDSDLEDVEDAESDSDLDDVEDEDFDGIFEDLCSSDEERITRG